MTAKSLPHGMGAFFKECEHPALGWPKCPHNYKTGPVAAVVGGISVQQGAQCQVGDLS